ncbi:hypothetical protein GT045_15605 [Streptomyces sp. SID486]|uniref:hypothetical protein n=1 Tax=unclassified Streptomyces TaxID=2593676 RepID=UPI00136F6DA9|nr:MULTISPECIES: hypothetical protein [unclassified Streptomyces]MYW49195.1 hypothetical protein [Streptomyces sp. SID161]MYX96198.1 hypothetical protein [Streptomyces sp. SID486]
MDTATRRRSLKFTAVLTLVVLSLTGFSRGRHHGGGGGGGCSSSHQNHGSSTSSTSGGSSGGYSDSSGGSSYDSSYGSGDDSTGTTTGGGSYRRTHRPTSTPSGSGTGRATQKGTVKLVSCATGKRPYATVEIGNPNRRTAKFTAWVTFYDAGDGYLWTAESPEVSVSAHGKATARVPLRKQYLDAVDHCEADEEARLRS